MPGIPPAIFKAFDFIRFALPGQVAIFEEFAVGDPFLVFVEKINESGDFSIIQSEPIVNAEGESLNLYKLTSRS